MAGASKPITVYMKQQRLWRQVRDGALLHSGSRPVAEPHDMRSRMRESSTDLREPQGSNPLGPPGPELELGTGLRQSGTMTSEAVPCSGVTEYWSCCP